MDQNPDPDFIPNIVIHPGDTIAVGGVGNTDITITLRDRSDGHPYAVLDCERNRDGEFIVCDIRFVAARRGPPVRPQPEPEPDPHGLTVYDAVPDTTNPNATISANYDTDGKPVPQPVPSPDSVPQRNVILSHFGTYWFPDHQRDPHEHEHDDRDAGVVDPWR